MPNSKARRLRRNKKILETPESPPKLDLNEKKILKAEDIFEKPAVNECNVGSPPPLQLITKEEAVDIVQKIGRVRDQLCSHLTCTSDSFLQLGRRSREAPFDPDLFLSAFYEYCAINSESSINKP